MLKAPYHFARSFVARSCLRANMASTTVPDGTVIKFGPFEVTREVFLTTRHSFGLVNIKPLVPGHVLVCPRAPHRRLTDLSADEVADLFTTVQLTQRLLARAHFRRQPSTDAGSSGARPPPGDPQAGSFNVAVQDGAAAGQTVPHVHVHVIPRTEGDLGGAPVDDIYRMMTAEEGNVGGALWDRARRPAAGGAMPRIEDSERADRTPEEMHEEVARYKTLLKELDVGEAN